MLILVIWHIICSFNNKYLIINLKKNIQFNNIWIFIILIGNSVSILSQNMPNVGNENWLGGNLSLKVMNILLLRKILFLDNNGSDVASYIMANKIIDIGTLRRIQYLIQDSQHGEVRLNLETRLKLNLTLELMLLTEF